MATIWTAPAGDGHDGGKDYTRQMCYNHTCPGRRSWDTTTLHIVNTGVKPQVINIKCSKDGGSGTIQLLGGAHVMAVMGPAGGWRRNPPSASLKGCDFGCGTSVVKFFVKNISATPILYDIGVFGGWGIEGSMSPIFIEVGETVCYTFSNSLAKGF